MPCWLHISKLSRLTCSDSIEFDHQKGEVPSEDIPQLVKMRHDILATIALPDNPPELTLAPIVLPGQVTLHDFINGAPIVSSMNRSVLLF